jgi:hypothetical protein
VEFFWNFFARNVRLVPITCRVLARLVFGLFRILAIAALFSRGLRHGLACSWPHPLLGCFWLLTGSTTGTRDLCFASTFGHFSACFGPSPVDLFHSGASLQSPRTRSQTECFLNALVAHSNRNLGPSPFWKNPTITMPRMGPIGTDDPNCMKRSYRLHSRP